MSHVCSFNGSWVVVDTSLTHAGHMLGNTHPHTPMYSVSKHIRADGHALDLRVHPPSACELQP